MKVRSTDDFSFINETLSKYLIFKKCVSFLTSVFQSTKEKMKIGHENKNLSNFYCFLYIFYFFKKIF